MGLVSQDMYKDDSNRRYTERNKVESGDATGERKIQEERHALG